MSLKFIVLSFRYYYYFHASARLHCVGKTNNGAKIIGRLTSQPKASHKLMSQKVTNNFVKRQGLPTSDHFRNYIKNFYFCSSLFFWSNCNLSVKIRCQNDKMLLRCSTSSAEIVTWCVKCDVVDEMLTLRLFDLFA